LLLIERDHPTSTRVNDDIADERLATP